MISHSPEGLRLVVMGPSGCGKTTLARGLAKALHLRFLEGDELHPASNVEKMRSGVALDDEDRAPWLDAVAQSLATDCAPGVVAACSALKRRYRDRLRAAAGPLVFILPVASRQVLAQRMAARTGHYMPVALLESQLADFEPLADDELGFTIDGSAGLSAQIELIRAGLHPST